MHWPYNFPKSTPTQHENTSLCGSLWIIKCPHDSDFIAFFMTWTSQTLLSNATQSLAPDFYEQEYSYLRNKQGLQPMSIVLSSSGLAEA